MTIFDDMTAMLSNRDLQLIVTELFIRNLKINIYIVFIAVLFCFTKNIRLNSMDSFVRKIQDKQELQQTKINHSTNTDFSDFMKL